MNPKHVDHIAALMKETGEAHHEAYIETDGYHPDWPLWYAEQMLEPLNALLNASMTRSELVYLLIKLDIDRRTEAPGAEWTTYNARVLAGLYL